MQIGTYHTVFIIWQQICFTQYQPWGHLRPVSYGLIFRMVNCTHSLYGFLFFIIICLTKAAFFFNSRKKIQTKNYRNHFLT